MFSIRLVASCLALGSASAQMIEIEGRYWIARTDVQVRVAKFGLATDIDLKKDLGIGDEGFPEGQVTWSHGSNRLRFDFIPIRYSGDHDVSRTIVFNGRTYIVGTRVISSIDVN